MVYSSLSGLLFVLSWNRRVISAISFYGVRVLGSYGFLYSISDWKSLISTNSESQNSFLVSSWAECFQGCSVFELLAFWINHSKHKIDKCTKFLSTLLYKPYDSSFRIFFSFIY